ncbi:Gfo/Idh/MocA family protein [Sphingobium bisphenolivorans]|uniref:Gfo/Idh/MocA family protein n=1 Tax=Sphingobium bisphenolivorans TaxID=1335760 RepID=UPI0003AAB7D3|nr:Gfo/Idh/MocA family oxidoreductase [Sphingobium bisphenolivorans]
MSLTSAQPTLITEPKAAPLRLGFLGTGWIGRHRLGALASLPHVEVSALSDPDASCLAAARDLAADAEIAADLDAMLALDLDGLVIATPSALHATQAIRALNAGIAVFCQKPLGRSASEVSDVISAARCNDRLLGIDMSYRFTEAVQAVRRLLDQGTLGHVHSIDLTFHNAYGPDKPWFYDPLESGGGCVMDLGIHLADLALWLLDFPEVVSVSSALKSNGRPLLDRGAACEDYATAMVELASGATLRLTCSWRLHAGQDAIISAAFYGTEGGAQIRNMDGSFYDFAAEYMRGTSCERLTSPPDDWGGRAIVDWSNRLAVDRGFDAGAERLLDVARLLDRIYAGA